MKVQIKNPKSGEIKEIKIGWSWILFLFSGFFGLPLFLRKLNVWGGIFFALWIGYIIIPMFLPPGAALSISLFIGLIMTGLSIYMGLKGNEITVKNYLENGWEFIDPESDITKMAKMKWKLQ